VIPLVNAGEEFATRLDWHPAISKGTMSIAQRKGDIAFRAVFACIFGVQQ
jgi:hypothetical protein